MSVEGNSQGAVDSERIRFGPTVSLSYDGADPSHLEIVLPALADFDLQGTFYATEGGLLEDVRAWQAVQNAGHEVGCHSLLEAADGLGNLPKWTLENVEADLRAFRKLLAEVFPRQSDCSFAYPGVEALCMSNAYDPVPTPYTSAVQRVFRIARSAREGLVDPPTADVMNLESVYARDLTLDDLIVAAEAAMVEARWAIFAFRGVGAGEGAVDREVHLRFCEWLSDHRGQLRTGTVFSLGMELQEKRMSMAGAYSWSLQSE